MMVTDSNLDFYKHLAECIVSIYLRNAISKLLLNEISKIGIKM